MSGDFRVKAQGGRVVFSIQSGDRSTEAHLPPGDAAELLAILPHTIATALAQASEPPEDHHDG